MKIMFSLSETAAQARFSAEATTNASFRRFEGSVV